MIEPPTTGTVRPFPFQRLPRVPRLLPGVVRALRQQVEDAAGAWQRWSSRYAGGSVAAPALGLVTRPTTAELDGLDRACPAVLELRGAGGVSAWIALDGRVCSSLLSLLLPGDPAPLLGPLSDAELGLVTYLVAALLHELDCGWSVVPGRGVPVRDEVVSVEIRVGIGGRDGEVTMVLPRQLLPVPVGAGSTAPLRHPGRLRWVPCDAAVELCRLCLPAVEVDLLGEGDVLLSPGLPAPETEGPLAGRLVAGEASYPVSVVGRDVELTGTRELGGDVMDAGAHEADTRVVAESLPLELTVELGRLRLNAAGLLDLEVGDVLTLDRAVQSSVDLRVGDRLVARGELVDVEGEAGVRLTEVYE